MGNRWLGCPLRRAAECGIVATLSLSALPSHAQSTDLKLDADPSYLAAAAVAILLALLFLAYRHHRQLRRDRDRCAAAAAVAHAALDTDTEGVALWRRDAHHIDVPPRLAGLLGFAGKPTATVDDLSACLAPEDGAGFASAALQLRVDGTPFELIADAIDGKRQLQITGARLSVPEYGEVDRLAFRDVSKSLGQMREVERSRNRLAAILDSLPMPVWLRRADLSLVYGNAAYARAVDAGREEAIARSLEFTSGTDKASGQVLARRALERGALQSEEKHVVVAGDRRLFEIVETPLPSIGPGLHIVGRALDKTALEESRGELARHVGAHGDVLESLSTSIVIFGPDQRLKFFNNEYVKQFGVDEDFLESEPLLGEVLEALRERRKLPEQLDMPRYKKEIARELMSLMNPREELLHLPDETTIRMVATPHPFGGVVITYEDVTDTLRVERLYNTLIQVQRETPRSPLRGHRRVRQRRPPEAQQPRLLAHLGPAGGRPPGRAARLRHRRPHPLLLPAAPALAAPAPAHHQPRQRPRRPPRPPRPQRRHRARSSPRCRWPTAAASTPTSTSPTARGWSARCASATPRWKPPTA